MAFEVKKIILFNKGTTKIKGKATISTPVGFDIEGFKIIQVDGKDPFVSAPQEKLVIKDETKYVDIVKFHDDDRGQKAMKIIEKIILDRYRQEKKKQSGSSGGSSGGERESKKETQNKNNREAKSKNRKDDDLDIVVGSDDDDSWMDEV